MPDLVVERHEAPSPSARGLTVAFTGHRPDKLGGWDPLHPVVHRVKTAIRRALAEEWPKYVISGMALGVDQWAAEIAVELGIPFIAALACDNPEAPWPLPSQERYRALIAKARQVVIVSPGPYKPWKLQRRNEWMVDNCDRLFAVHDGSGGGTFNCLMYAESLQRSIRRLEWHA